jgi:DNA-binding SARP family transcriptional activator
VNERTPDGAPVLAARVTRPEVRASVRERLDRALAECLHHRLTLITGPAGYGKTTLLAQFVTRADIPAGWYRAEAGDGSVASMLAHVRRALRKLVPADTAPWASVAEAVAALEEADGRLGLLAVDDLHTLAGSPAEAALGRLVEQAPTWLRVVATCRQAPAWNLSRLRVSGDLLEIGPEQLRFRTWEVERLFCDFYGAPLPPGDLAQLARGLEGWAAGLQLFHLATRGKSASERRRAVASLPSGSRYIREYLAENVVGDLRDDLRGFLVDTAALGRLTPRLCDELRGTHGSQAVLEELEGRQVFLTRLEDDSFRWHEAFRTHLERMLYDRDGEAATRERFARAGDLLEAAGFLGDALRAHCRAERWDAVARQLRVGGEELVEDRGQWLDALPVSLLDDPWVLLATARRSVAIGRWDDALARYDEAARVFGVARAADLCRRERDALAQWMVPGASSSGDWSGRLRLGVRGTGVTGLPGASAPPGPPSLAGSAGDALTAALLDLLRGDLRRAAASLLALVDDEPSKTTAAAAWLGLAVVGALAPATPGAVSEDALELVPELVEGAGVPWLSWLAQACPALNGDDAARAAALAVADRLDRHGDPWGSVLARVFAVLRPGPGPEAPAQAAAVAQRLRELDAPVLAVWIDVWHAVALSRVGNPGAAAALAQAERAARDAGLDALWESAREQLATASPPPAATPDREATEAARSEAAVGAAPTSASGAPVVLRCLGRFTLEVGGRPVDWSAVKPRARSALRLLAVQPGNPVHVETLVDALWGELDVATGKRNVQVALSSVRKVLEGCGAGSEGPLVAREGAAYVLTLPAGADADVVEFQDRLDEARRRARDGDASSAVDAYEAALSAYAGELLPEEGPADWVVDRRERLRQQAVEAARQAAAGRLELGEPSAAIAACQRGLEIERFDDALWRQLIAAQLASGELAAANRSQASYEQVLAELGLANQPVT